MTTKARGLRFVPVRNRILVSFRAPFFSERAPFILKPSETANQGSPLTVHDLGVISQRS